jgi:hypothetical protein
MKFPVEEIKDSFNWFFGQTTKNAVIVLLSIFIVYQYFQIDELKQQVAKLQVLNETNIELEKKLNAISAEIVIFKASTDYFPFPYWIKDTYGKVIYVNEAYVNKYLRPRGLTYSNYVGHYDISVYPPEQAAQYGKNDSLVIALAKPISFIEKDNDKLIRVTKFPYRLNGLIVGVAGVEYANF